VLFYWHGNRTVHNSDDQEYILSHPHEFTVDVVREAARLEWLYINARRYVPPFAGYAFPGSGYER
jgi:hypothetical protein